MTSRQDGSERLEDILAWLRTAKENLPDLNNGRVSADQISAASALIDRMQRAAIALRATLGDAQSQPAARRAA